MFIIRGGSNVLCIVDNIVHIIITFIINFRRDTP